MDSKDRIRLNNQDVYIDGKWVGHISVSGNSYYGALPGKFFQGASQMEVAEQIMAALDGSARETEQPPVDHPHADASCEAP
jgi:hypothetical protein